MGYAYEWLSEREKNNIDQIFITYDEIRIVIDLYIVRNSRTFEYTKDVGGVTSVVDKQTKQDTWIDKYFVDVACEDLNLLVVNQTAKLKRLLVKCISQDATDQITTVIFDNLRVYLKSRSSPLQVEYIDLIPTTVSERMSVVQYLDHEQLSCIGFNVEDHNGKMNIDGFSILKVWNRGCPIDLNLGFNNLTKEDLEAISRLSQLNGTFRTIQAFYRTCNEEEISKFFNPELIDKVDLRQQSFKINLLASSPTAGEDEIAEFFEKMSVEDNETKQSSIKENQVLNVMENSVIMKIIIEKLSFFEIQNLRKVTSGIRKCVDDLKPEPHIQAYTIRLLMAHSFITTFLHGTATIEFKNGNLKTIQYQKEHQNRILKDFKVNLLHQNTCLEELKIVYETLGPTQFPRDTPPNKREISGVIDEHLDKYMFSTQFGEVLKGRKYALKVKTFTMGVFAQDEVMKVLPYIDKDSIKKLVVNRPNRAQPVNQAHPDPPLYELFFEIDEITTTEQWKRADQLSIVEPTVTTPMPKMNIAHFANVDILVHTVSSEDVSYLKTELLKSSTLEKFKIKFKTSTIDERLHGLIGEPYRAIQNVKKIWYFRMPNTDFYLHIVLDTHDLQESDGNPRVKVLVLAKVAKEDTPFFI